MSTFPDMNHLELIRSGQRSLANALPLLDTAEACGLDCREYRQGIAVLGQRLAQYHARLFPDQAHGIDPEGVSVVPTGRD